MVDTTPTGHPVLGHLRHALPRCNRGHSLYAMAQWGREHWGLAQTLGFTPGQTPCVATLHLVFRRLDKAAFEAALRDWAQATLGDSRVAIPIDGKSLRVIHGEELPGVHLVAAHAQGAGLVLAQKGGVESKEGELTVAPQDYWPN